MQRKLISATFLLPLPTAMWEAWQPGTPPPVKGFCEKTTLSPSVASTNRSLQQETASARITSPPFSAPSSIQFAAAQQSAPKVTLVFQNWKMAQTTLKERMTTAWVQRGLVNWPFLPASGNWNLTGRDWMEPDRTKAPETAATDRQILPKG